MSPENKTRGGKIIAASNVYTVMLALALCAVLATAGLLAYKCYFQYGTIFTIP